MVNGTSKFLLKVSLILRMIPQILAAVFAMFLCVCVPLAVATESNAQMFVLFNKLYDGFYQNKVGLNILNSK